MRRLLCAFWLLVAVAHLATVVLVAQSPLRPRWHRFNNESSPNTAPLVNVTDPPLQTFQTPATTLSITGTCSDAETQCDLVTATNDRGGGTINAVGTGAFSIQGSASDVTLIDTSFVNSASIDLKDYVVAPTGGAITQLINNSNPAAGTNFIRLFQPSDQAYPRFDDLTVGAKMLYQMAPVSAISGANYTWSVPIALMSTDATVPMHLAFGIVDSSNFCLLSLYGSQSSTGAYLSKVVANVVTTLSSTSTHITASQTADVIVNGTAVSAKIAGTQVLSATTTDCDNGTGVGIGFGALRSSSDRISSSMRMAAATLVDHGGSGSGIPLFSGTNHVTVTGRDTDGNTTNYVITVTQGAMDTQPAVPIITTPSTLSPYPTSSASQTVGGTASDNVGVTSVTWTCATCTPTSGTASGSMGGTNVTWSVPGLTITCSGGGTQNTFVVSAHDAAGNTPGTDTIRMDCTSGDTTPPVISITTPASSPFAAPSSTVSMAGTAIDDVLTTLVTYSGTTCGAGTATGTTSWNISSLTLTGGCTVTINACDQAGNCSQATQVFTFTPALTFQTTSLPNGTQGASYLPCLAASGGTGSYTFTKIAGTLPTGLTLLSTGCFSGTPSGTGTSSGLQFRVTDGAAATADSGTMSLTIVAAGSGPNAYFDALVAAGTCYRALSFRPDATQTTKPTFTDGVANCTTPSYFYMFNAKGTAATAGFRESSLVDPDMPVPQYVAAQDAALFQINAFSRYAASQTGDNLLTSPLSATPANAADDTFTVTNCAAPNNSLLAKGNQITLKIDNEYMVIINPSCSSPANLVHVARAQFGSTIAAHSVGTLIKRSQNDIHGGYQIRVPVGATDNATYLYTWDFKTTSSSIGESNGYKAFQMSDFNDSIWFEQRLCWNVDSSCAPGTVKGAGDLGGIDTRTYNLATTETLWANTTGNQGRFTNNSGGATAPRTATPNFTVHADRWTRVWVLWDQKANDWDYVNMWVADEVQNPVHILGSCNSQPEMALSVRPGAGSAHPFTVQKWWAEFDVSQDGFLRSSESVSFVNYVRNFVVSKSTTPQSTSAFSCANMDSTILVKPLAGP